LAEVSDRFVDPCPPFVLDNARGTPPRLVTST
jgi:hypothetical protein